MGEERRRDESRKERLGLWRFSKGAKVEERTRRVEIDP